MDKKTTICILIILMVLSSAVCTFADTNNLMVIKECIFQCGGAAVPEGWKPPVRNWKPLLITSTHSAICLTRRPHALRYPWMDQCFRY